MNSFFDFLDRGEMPREVRHSVSRFKGFLTFLTTSPYFKNYVNELTVIEDSAYFDLPYIVECASALTPTDVRTLLKNQDHADYLFKAMAKKLLAGEDNPVSIFAALFDYYETIRMCTSEYPLDRIH